MLLRALRTIRTIYDRKFHSRLNKAMTHMLQSFKWPAIVLPGVLQAVRRREQCRDDESVGHIAEARVSALLAMLLVGTAAMATEKVHMPPDAQIEYAARAVWLNGGNYRSLCADDHLLDPDQQGLQELTQNFAPGQWAIRVARSREKDVARMDYLAQAGFLDRREVFLNIGPISTVPALEYRPTLAGWVQSMNREEDTAYYPCFYFGMAQVLKVTDYTESEKGPDGYSTVKINFVRGASEIESWADTPEAAALFPSIRRAIAGYPGNFTFVRAPNGKLKIYRDAPNYIDDIVAPTRTYPDMDTAREAVARTRDSPNLAQGLVLPPACLPLIPKYSTQLWKAGDKQAATEAVFMYSAQTSGTAREVEERTYMRLVQLQRAGLLSLKVDTVRGRVLVRPAAAIRALIEKDGNCLPLGTTRIDIAGLQTDDWPGDRRRFKARYIVEQPARWIQAIPKDRLPPDLAVVLQYGQPFEGTVLKLREGWGAGYIVDRRPRVTPPRLGSIGAASFWHNVTEQSIARTLVEEHDVHLVSVNGGAPNPKTPQIAGYANTYVDVQVHPGVRPAIVVLSGYEPIEWRFKVHPKAHIRAVIAVGYHDQTVRGLPAGVTLVTANSSGLAINPARTFDDKEFAGRISAIINSARTVDDREFQKRIGAMLGTASLNIHEPEGAGPVMIGSLITQSAQNYNSKSISAPDNLKQPAEVRPEILKNPGVPSTHPAPLTQKNKPKPSEMQIQHFAERLYEISVYTAEDAAMGRILDAEIALVASRFLAQQLVASGGRAPTSAPAGWKAMVKRLKAAVRPIAEEKFQERAQILKTAELYGKAPYVRQYEKLLRNAKSLGIEIQFANGGQMRQGQDQSEDIPEILMFHREPAATKWRNLWPDLRVYAAKMVALHSRAEADPGLGVGKPQNKRVTALVRKVRGRVITSQEWLSISTARLGHTLAGMQRFPMPLGTELQATKQQSEGMRIQEGKGGTVMISSVQGTPLHFAFLDAQWDKDISRRLSVKEIERIDEALTASYDKNKDRWFAALGLEWDAHVDVTASIQQSKDMQALYSRFAEESNAAMAKVWSTWQ